MILFTKYEGTLFYLVPMPFAALGRCEACNANVLLIGLNIGKKIFTLQIHPEINKSKRKINKTKK